MSQSTTDLCPKAQMQGACGLPSSRSLGPVQHLKPERLPEAEVTPGPTTQTHRRILKGLEEIQGALISPDFLKQKRDQEISEVSPL